MSVPLAVLPIVDADRAVTSLRGHDPFLGIALRHLLHVVEAATSVPVYAQAPHHIAHSGVAEECMSVCDDVIFVVVPSKELELRVHRMHGGVEVASEEVHLLVRTAVQAALEDLSRLGLVLNGHSPDGHTVLLVRLHRQRQTADA